MINSILKLLLTTVILTVFSCKNYQSLDAYLEEMHQNGKLNGNILVVKNDSIIINSSFGYIDGSKNSELTPDYRFNIGSIYKEFPAVAIMQLQEQGKLQLSHSLNTYIKELPKWSEEITILHLLQYTSGLPKVDWNKYFENDIKLTDDKIWKDLLNVGALQFEPGTDYIYTNYSPILLMKIVERISGLSFKDFANRHLFIPSEMKSIVLKNNFPYENKDLMAIPFDENFKEDAYRMSTKNLLFLASTKDLYQWLKTLHQGKIINRNSLKKLSEEYDGFGNISAPIGYCEWQDDQVIEHSHHGSSVNYEGIVRYFPDEDLYIVVLTNQKHGNVREISDELRTIVNKKTNR
ncbi:serine hydrolase domain-containing protein [Gangjinia marincola]|uniref:Serine hydrolase domain-containing protein n=1 Tax=Gangjinia marincola TaxID=578463 RepID=A0ABP3XUR2_9FLAO